MCRLCPRLLKTKFLSNGRNEGPIKNSNSTKYRLSNLETNISQLLTSMIKLRNNKGNFVLFLICAYMQMFKKVIHSVKFFACFRFVEPVEYFLKANNRFGVFKFDIHLVWTFLGNDYCHIEILIECIVI